MTEKSLQRQTAGRACAAKLGRDHMREIGARGGRKGGKALVEQRGTQYMRELGRRAAAKRKPGWNAGGERSEATRENMREGQRRRREAERKAPKQPPKP